MSPKPYMPGDDVEFINGVGIRKKKNKSGNSKKRTAYFLQQRFPHLETVIEEKQDAKIPETVEKRLSVEKQQAVAAPLARVRKNMMQEYRQRVLVQQEEQEKAAAKKIQAGDGHD